MNTAVGQTVTGREAAEVRLEDAMRAFRVQRGALSQTTAQLVAAAARKERQAPLDAQALVEFFRCFIERGA